MADRFDTLGGPMPGDWRQQFGGALPPPFMETKQEVASRLAGQRTDKWRRRLYGLAAGLQAARGASNFGEGLLGGLSGSLMGGEQFQRHQDEQEQVRLKGEQQKADREYRMLQDAIGQRHREAQLRESIRHNTVAEQRTPGVGAVSRGEALARMAPEDFATMLERERELASARRGPGRAAKPKANPFPKVKPGQAYSLSGEKVDAKFVGIAEQLKTDTDVDAIRGAANDASLPGSVRAVAMQRLAELGAQ